MRYPRWINRWYANIRGYFWLPCPRCGMWFGGHETGGHDWIVDSDCVVLGQMTCWRCPTDETLISGYWRRGHWVDIANELAEIRRR